MKRIAAVALFVAATLITTGSAFAQNPGVKASVPFNFNAGGTWISAGTYTIGATGLGSKTIEIGAPGKGSAAMALGIVNQSEPSARGELVFHRVGESYFLREVRYAYSSTKVCLPVSKAEKKARQRAMEATDASLPINDNIQIAMN
jgi:hypothetical protein